MRVQSVTVSNGRKSHCISLYLAISRVSRHIPLYPDADMAKCSVQGGDPNPHRALLPILGPQTSPHSSVCIRHRVLASLRSALDPPSWLRRWFGEAVTWAAVTAAVTRKLSGSKWQMAMISRRSRPRCARQPHVRPSSQRAVFHSTRCRYACHGCVESNSPARASLLLRILTCGNAITLSIASHAVY